jgi:hypothetical protein
VVGIEVCWRVGVGAQSWEREVAGGDGVDKFAFSRACSATAKARSVRPCVRALVMQSAVKRGGLVLCCVAGVWVARLPKFWLATWLLPTQPQDFLSLLAERAQRQTKPNRPRSSEAGRAHDGTTTTHQPPPRVDPHSARARRKESESRSHTETTPRPNTLRERAHARHTQHARRIHRARLSLRLRLWRARARVRSERRERQRAGYLFCCSPSALPASSPPPPLARPSACSPCPARA